MKHFDTNWETKDGLNIYAQGWDPAHCTPKAVICLLHGIGDHTSRYSHVAEAITNEGFAFFGADLRGHGRSGGPRGHFPSDQTILNDIDILLEHTHIKYPGLPLFLYGFSLGGILLLYYALKRKPDVKGIITAGIGLHNTLEEQPVKVLLVKITGSFLPSLLLPNGLDTNALSQNKEVVKLFVNDPFSHNRISSGFGKILLHITRWNLEHAGEFSLPLLLMHGKKDTVAYPSSSIEFAAAQKNHCKLVLWDNAYHEIHNEPVKNEVLRTMVDWLNEQLS